MINLKVLKKNQKELEQKQKKKGEKMKNRFSVNKLFRSAVCILLAVIMLALCACNGGGEEPQPSEQGSTLLVRVVKVKNDASAGEALGAADVELVEIDATSAPEDLSERSAAIIAYSLGDIVTMPIALFFE